MKLSSQSTGSHPTAENSLLQFFYQLNSFLTSNCQYLSDDARLAECFGQDTSACHTLSHSFNAFSLECPETLTSLNFLPPEGHHYANTDQNRIASGGWSGYISMTHFRPFLPCISVECHETPISLSFLATIGTKIGRILAKINSFLEVVRIYQHVTFWDICALHCP